MESNTQQASQAVSSRLYFPGNSHTYAVARSDQFALTVHGNVIFDEQPVNATFLLSRLSASDIPSVYAHLSGQFWLVLEHLTSGKVSIFNDHLGMKPCYYRQAEDRVFVSASLQDLKQHSDLTYTLSNQAIYHYIYFHCIPAPLSIYQDTYKLEPGTCLSIEKGNVEKTVLYRPHFHTAAKSSETDLQKQCLDIIEHSVRQGVGEYDDERVGAFLSGGLDSSSVAGMLSRHTKPAKTFSIGFDTPDYDETPYAKITAKHFGTQHEVLYLQPDEAADAFVKVAQYFDEPFGNSSSMAAYFCARFAKEQGVDTLLAGDGGDELFAGNERYAKQKTFELFFKVPGFLRSLMTGIFTKTPLQKIPGFSKVASYIRQANVRLPGRLQTYNFVELLGAEAVFTPEFLASVDTQEPLRQLEARYKAADAAHPVDQMLYLDWKFTLADNDLVKVSKMCELAGVEVHYPLLNRALVDFSCAVPAETKLPGQALRKFYKDTCKGFLADETLTKSKHGFGLPFGVWMKDHAQLQQITEDALSRIQQRGIVSESLIAQAKQAHKNVHAGYFGELIWILVVLELWLQGHE